MTKSLQDIAEEKVYDILFELENELGLETGKLPEVYYVGKDFDLNSIGLQIKDNSLIKRAIKHYPSFLLTPPGIIFTNSIKKNKLAEEVGHFMHLTSVNLNYTCVEEIFSFKVLAEMLGFFSSKLIDSSRKNAYRKINEFFPKEPDHKKFKNTLIQISNQNFQNFEKGVYAQGYGLGEKMFNYYISGKLSKKKIREIFTNPLDSKFETPHQFYHWKYEVLK